MPRIFLTHEPDMLKNYYGERAVAGLRKSGEIVINPTGRVLDGPSLIEAARGCEIIVSDRQTAGPREIFEKSPDLVAFLRCAVDIRNIDVAAANKAGVLVTQATPGFAASVSEMAIGYMIDLGRRITGSVIQYRQGREADVHMGNQLNGATLGIIGYGVIGEYLAPLGVALGMTVLVADPFKKVETPGVRQVDQDTLLRDSDYVVCLVVATNETENLMNADVFAAMKLSAFFINMSRGNLVDEAALARALDKKQIAGAAMDVGRAQDQRPSLALASRRDVIATPHTAGATPQSVEHQAFDTVRQVAELVAGRIPVGAVNTAQAMRMERLRKG